MENPFNPSHSTITLTISINLWLNLTVAHLIPLMLSVGCDCKLDYNMIT